MSIWTLPENKSQNNTTRTPCEQKGTCGIMNWYSFVLQFFLATVYFIQKKTHRRLKKPVGIFRCSHQHLDWSSRPLGFLNGISFTRVNSYFPMVFGPMKISRIWNRSSRIVGEVRLSSFKCYSLRIQSPCQMMIGVYNHLLSKVFRFHYHSQKVIGP